MPLPLAGDAVRNAWTLCVAGGVLPLAQGAVCGPLCALVGPGVLSVPGSYGRPVKTPASAGLEAGPNTCTKPGLNLGTWPEPWLAPSGVSADGYKHCWSFAAVWWSSSCRLCMVAGYSPVWSSSDVAAVCRRPVKDPPRQFGERAFTGFPWASA